MGSPPLALPPFLRGVRGADPGDPGPLLSSWWLLLWAPLDLRGVLLAAALSWLICASWAALRP